MSSKTPKKKIIIIFGQMAVGKTDVSIKLAEKIGGEIILADSLVFYKGFDIGINKPTKFELSRVPHHLIDIALPDAIVTLSDFFRNVECAVKEIVFRKKIPVIVGGTGYYIRSFVNKFSSLGTNKTYLDGVPALETILLGLRIPQHRHYARINSRVDDKFRNGFVDEVKNLLALGYSPDLPTMSAIGYKECIELVRGRLSEENAIKEIKLKSHLFARRQSIWFTEKDPIKWFEISENCVSDIEHYISEYD